MKIFGTNGAKKVFYLIRYSLVDRMAAFQFGVPSSISRKIKVEFQDTQTFFDSILKF